MSKRIWLKLTIPVVVVGATVAFLGTRAPRTEAKAEDAKAFPVAVAKASRTDLANELVCYAEFRPYQEVELHAKVAGYVKNINVDIGDRVAEGQELALLEVPELHDELTRSEAGHARALNEVESRAAAYDLAHVAYMRLSKISKEQPNLIAQQDLDDARDKDRRAQAALAASKQQVQEAQAEINKFKTMLTYSHITAPFKGVITKRYADPGALIQAGTTSNTQAMPLVRLSENDHLRLDFPISISYVSRIHTGDAVEVRVQALNRTFTGKVSRVTEKVDADTRTMQAEVEVPNPKLELIPGMYASVVIKLDVRQKALVVPVEALARDKQPSVYLVNARHHIEARPVKTGLETPTKVEITSGLQENDLVMIGARSLVKPGQLVEPKLLTVSATE